MLLDKYVYESLIQTSAIKQAHDGSGTSQALHRSRFKWSPSTVKHRAFGRLLRCEVHLELLSKYQENQTVTTLKEVDGWSLRKSEERYSQCQ